MAASNQLSQRHAAQRGVTLLENMVALLIISVGLLGFAGMQAFTLRGSASSTHRQLAMQLAQDMADRIRANPGAYFDVSDKINHYHAITPSASPSAAVDCRIKRCDAANLAAFDVYEWQLANFALPGDRGIAGGYVISDDLINTSNDLPIPLSVEANMPVRKRFTIAIRWDGDGTGSKFDKDFPADCTRALPDEMKCYALVIDL